MSTMAAERRNQGNAWAMQTSAILTMRMLLSELRFFVFDAAAYR